ncbi:helix-turn-helix domain-containing protein [Paenibacillus sp. GCM10023252]|uniref:AraC family transcriptional regulator n=1 Tax=Paenibacillus sp. GCM10023252 TaxID=3252649 RepID=UPI003619D410
MNRSRFFLLPAMDSLPYGIIAVGHVKDDPKHRVTGNRYAEHIYNLHLAVRGRGWVHTATNKIPIGAMEGFLYSEHQIQCYEADAAEPWEVWWIYFKGEGIRSLLHKQILGEEPWRIPVNSGRRILPLIETLWELAGQNDAANLPVVSSTLYRILLELLTHSAAPPSSASARLEHRLQFTAEYMRAHCNQPLTLEQLADHSGVSSAYFSRTFHAHFGMPPLDYLAQMRIELAKQMLIVTHKTIKQIAFEVGYGSPSYFIERFRRIVGMTPAAYRGASLNPPV